MNMGARFERANLILTRFPTYGREPDPNWSLFPNSVKNFGRRIFGNIVRDLLIKINAILFYFSTETTNLKITESTRPFGMYHPFRDALSIEMSHVLNKMCILQ